MSKTIFFISDSHFDHGNILRFTDFEGKLIRGSRFSSIEEMNETIIQNWNSVVKPQDHVYHMGDVTFRPNMFARIACRLNGHKRLLVGNHDDVKNLELSKWFEKIMLWRMFKDENFTATHVPLPKDQFRYKVKYNLHGHTHQELIDDPAYINNCVEHTNYFPRSLEEIREIIKIRNQSL